MIEDGHSTYLTTCDGQIVFQHAFTYHQVFLQKRPCYTRRLDYYSDGFIDKHPSVETVLFPCLSNDDDINYGLGITKFTNMDHEDEPQFILL